MENEKELVINGSTMVNGIEIPNICGGFNKDSKVILANTVSKLHGRPLGDINALINNNRSHFVDGIDIFNLKNNKYLINILIDNKIVTKNAVNASKYIYLLSKSGYEIICSILENANKDTIDQVFRKCFNSFNTNIIFLNRYESEFKNLLFSILGNFIAIKCQFPILQYRVDFFIPSLKLIIEEGHIYNKEKDHKREENIQEEFKRWHVEDEYTKINILRINKNNEYVGIGEIMKIATYYGIFKEMYIGRKDRLSYVENLYDYFMDFYTKEYCDEKNIFRLKSNTYN